MLIYLFYLGGSNTPKKGELVEAAYYYKIDEARNPYPYVSNNDGSDCSPPSPPRINVTSGKVA